MIPGVALVVGGIPGSMHLGFWVGVLSAALAALFNALNKRYLGHHDAMAVTWLELGAGFLVVTAIAALAAPDGEAFLMPSVHDGAWLLVLAILCTLIPFAVSLATLRHLSAFTAQLAINLEPLYAIVARGAVPGRGARARRHVLPGRGHRARRGFRPRMAANAGSASYAVIDRRASVCMIGLHIYLTAVQRLRGPRLQM